MALSNRGNNLRGELEETRRPSRKTPFTVVALVCAAGVWLAAYGLLNHHAGNLARRSREAGRAEYVTADSRRRIIESFYRPELIGGMVQSNDLAAVRAWIARHPGDKGVLFGVAIAEGKPDILTVVLASGFRPNDDLVVYRDGVGRERTQRRLQLALAIACAGGHAGVVKKLLELGGNPNGSDTIGCPILAVAAARGHAEVVRILLERGAPVNAAADVAPPIPAGPDAPFADTARVRRLSGKTALHLAAEYHHPAVVRLLLEHGADPRRLTPDGKTALQLCRAETPPPHGFSTREEAHPGGHRSPQAEVELLLVGALH